MKFKELDKSVRYAFYAMGFIFICLFIATGITINVAMDGHEPVVDPNYYEKGLNYEKVLEDIKIMKQEGYNIQSALFEDRLPLQRGDNDVVIHFTKSGEDLDTAEISIVRERGATFKFNETFPMKNIGQGKYQANVQIPELGQWMLTIKATDKGRTLSKTIKVVVQR
ncbi:MAG: FixH family protein [Leptospira sp.]|jgi:nitrogen fixation protein FixH|nr:FixH family protein [Leptospira sp.]